MRESNRVTIVVVAVQILVLAAVAQAGVRAQIEVQGDDVSNTILLDHPFLNGNPDALLVVSQAGWEVESTIQVYYSGAWRISNNSVAAIPSSATFWVLAFDEDSGFRHTTTVGNIAGHITALDDPRLNFNPAARPIVTPETTNGPAIPWPIGVFYSITTDRWYIFYQDTTKNMPINASFSVLVPDGQDWSFVHTATAGNITNNFTVIDNPDIDQADPHRIFASQRWEGTYNDNHIGIGWLFSFLIGNVDGSDMPEDAKFNVFIAPIFEDGFEMGSTVLWSSASP